MKKITLILLIVFSSLQLNAQMGPVNYIDTSVQSAGISKIISYDINNDGFKDIITSTAGTNGRFGYYLNQTNNSFGSFILIDNFYACRGVAVGDFNNDNSIDFVVIGEANNEAWIYLNNNGSFTSSLLSTNPTTYNEVIVADFDQNNSDDIVIIGQHSIDFFRNNGSGVFTQEVILSTSTSPLVLECLDLAVADIDNDGDMDLISGETAGVVIYTNNGNAIFTPHYYSIIAEIVSLIHPMDVDNDGDIDIISRNSGGLVKWFSNNGSGVMTYEAVLSSIPNLIAINSVDYNNDGLEDLYVSYTNHISVFANNTAHTFTNEVSMHQTIGLIMGQLGIVNIDNQGASDFVWSGGNNTLAFHINQSNLSVDNPNLKSNNLFPNPTSGILNFSEQIENVIVYSLIGQKLNEYSNVKSIDISSMSNGVYIIQLENQGKTNVQKIVKQ
ncbi:T9SS type A sorting domain-containing protein [Flavobacterium sp. SM2513]|uniref:T9SS type A sorting domain-containing protein n=1 Tax=Flavobacterium sp. SM2513 TaxID=3424766 RepID=UPI003D7F599D